MRLTNEMRQKLLDQNEGYTTSTSYNGRNASEGRRYEIRSGQLHVHAMGRTPWADSKYDDEFVADAEQTRRFLRENLYALNTDGLD